MFTHAPKTDPNKLQTAYHKHDKAKTLIQESSHSLLATQSNLLSSQNILQLQHTIGNRAVIQLLKKEIRMKPESKFNPFVISPRFRTPGLMQPVQKKEDPLSESQENNTGLPDNLKTGIETLAGIDLSDVRVHHNSDKPLKVGALAYTQGTNIYVAPGQEQHLPHESWHVVQQKQGRVRTTSLTAGLPLNDDSSLEREAEIMGSRAIQMKVEDNDRSLATTLAKSATKPHYKYNTIQNEVIQRKKIPLEETGNFRNYVNKEDIDAIKNLIYLNLYVVPQNMEARKNNIKGYKMTQEDIKKLKNICELRTFYEKWLNDYESPILNKMGEKNYFNIYEAREGTFENAIYLMTNALIELAKSCNKIEDGTYGDEESAEINDLRVHSSLNLQRIQTFDTEGMIAKLKQGTLTDRHHPNIRPNTPMHQHLHGGDQGIAFAYLASGDKLTPYLYDYASERQGNKYQWTVNRNLLSGPPKIP